VAEVDSDVTRTDEGVVEDTGVGEVRRQRGRGGTALVLVLLILAGLLFAADRVGANAAEKLIARQTKQELSARGIRTAREPSVDVGGFPFLAQVVRGRYDRITIGLSDVSSNGITLPKLDVVATGVHASVNTLASGDGKVTADQVTGTALLDWTAVRKLISVTGINGDNIEVKHASGDQVQIRIPLALAGVKTTLVAVGSVQPGQNGLIVKIADIATEGGNLPPIAQALLATTREQISFKVRTPDLPYGMKIRSVHTSDAGVQVTAAASGVPISGR
jgi:hypothetical protein